VSEHPGPPSLTLALRSVVGAQVTGSARANLLTLVRPGDGAAAVITFPAPRRPLGEPGDDPDAA
jgi:hypothetical protein